MNTIDFDEVRRQVTARVAEWDDEDVAVRVAQGRHPLHVTVSSKHPSTYYNQWIDLADDGTVHLPVLTTASPRSPRTARRPGRRPARRRPWRSSRARWRGRWACSRGCRP